MLGPLTRRGFVCAAALLAGFGLVATKADAAPFPSQPIKLVVGFPPGGSNDVVARIIAPAFSEVMGVPVVVDNRPGANATIGTEFVARSAPDGYTITLGSASPLAISPFTYPNIPYDTLKDFVGITTVAMTPELVAINPKVEAKTLQELVALGKKRQLTVSSSGNGGLPHLAIELFKTTSGADVLHVPYKGAGPAIVDTVGGHVDAIIVDIAGLLPLVKEGKLRALAVTADQRSPILPDVPTTADAGLPKLIAVNWFGIMAPAKTPPDVVQKLYEGLVKAVNTPKVKEQLLNAGMEPMLMSSPAAFQTFLVSELDRWGAIAKASNARSD
ncbi:tripartite tricarboxylate transporter substrate binding protein [Aquabacter sp. CN5-332]|uniref:Bug family tripartite tricarboxylate transporter substrate binding protein n=1 Tax=Aquabacter sp. CN5-332 TaxID=3156608 RepID=UPI0032B4910F